MTVLPQNTTEHVKNTFTLTQTQITASNKKSHNCKLIFKIVTSKRMIDIINHTHTWCPEQAEPRISRQKKKISKHGFKILLLRTKPKLFPIQDSTNKRHTQFYCGTLVLNTRQQSCTLLLNYLSTQGTLSEVKMMSITKSSFCCMCR